MYLCGLLTKIITPLRGLRVLDTNQTSIDERYLIAIERGSDIRAQRVQKCQSRNSAPATSAPCYKDRAPRTLHRALYNCSSVGRRRWIIGFKVVRIRLSARR